jgi:hypothetical protein
MVFAPAEMVYRTVPTVEQLIAMVVTVCDNLTKGWRAKRAAYVKRRNHVPRHGRAGALVMADADSTVVAIGRAEVKYPIRRHRAGPSEAYVTHDPFWYRVNPTDFPNGK